MDYSGIPIDQDHIDTPNVLSHDFSDKWTDHVKWQGSQTSCSALNQLIKSSVSETVQGTPRISGWQRVSSSDQLSNLHSTGHHDTASSSSLLPSHSRPSSCKPSSSSRPHSRARLSEARVPTPDSTNMDLPIPLFNKTNPMQFLDIMKGVSARLDENAGVRPRHPRNSSSSSRPKKRTRGVSLSGASEFQAGGKATCGIFKKGRVDELRTSDTLTWHEDKGKGRATTDEYKGLDSEMRGRGLQAHNSSPDVLSRSDLKRSLSSKDVSFMDVDERDKDIDLEQASRAAVSSSSNHDGYPDTCPFARTLSQAEMPPPPPPPPPFACDSFVHKQRQSAVGPLYQQSNTPLVSTPLADSRHCNSISKPQTLYPSLAPTNQSIKRKPDAIPKLHPLLYHKPAATRVASITMVTSAPRVKLQRDPVPISVSEGPDLKTPPPLFTSTPSSRPPPLGMRRNHTFPARTSLSSTVQQESSCSGNQLPQRQKGFKSPLLSLSQPQPQTQTQMQMHGPKTNTNAIVVESGNTNATSRKVSSPNSPKASSSTDNHGLNGTNNTSFDLRSPSSDSSTSFQSTPPAASSATSSHSSNSSDHTRSKKSNQGMMMAQYIQQPPQESVVDIPEPLDGDTDSSFGDMSFDLDALEETMKMYD